MKQFFFFAIVVFFPTIMTANLTLTVSHSLFSSQFQDRQTYTELQANEPVSVDPKGFFFPVELTEIPKATCLFGYQVNAHKLAHNLQVS